MYGPVLIVLVLWAILSAFNLIKPGRVWQDTNGSATAERQKL